MKKLLALLLLLPGMVWAACTSPAGTETDILYNGDFHTYQYCDGTNWQAIGGGIASWYYLNAIPSRVQAVSNGTPINLTGLTVTGTISGSSLITTAAGGTISGSVVNAGIISDTGGLLVAGQSSLANVSATAYQGNGALITNVTAAAMSWYGLTNLPTHFAAVSNGTYTPSWYSLTAVPTVLQNISNSTGSVTVTSVAATTGTFTNVAGTLTTAAQPNITSVGSLTGLTMAGNIVMGGNSITGGGTATFTTLAGTLSTAAQTNITSVGTLTSISDSGVLNVGGAISGSLTLFSGGLITGGAGANITGAVTATTTMQAGGLLTALSGVNVTGAVTATTTLSVPLVSATGAGLYSKAISNSGLIFTNTISTTGQTSATGSYVGNLTEAVVSQTATTSTTFLNTALGGQFFVQANSSTLISLTNGTPGKAVQIVVKQAPAGGFGITYTSPTHHWTNASFTSTGAITSTSMITSGSTFSLWVWSTPDGSTWLGGLAGSGG